MLLRHLLSDVRLGVRALGRADHGRWTAIAALALGVALTALTLAIVRTSTLSALPYADPSRLVHFEIAARSDGQPDLPVTPHDYMEWRASQSSFDDLAAFTEARLVFTDGHPSPPIDGLSIEPRGLALLGVRPYLGRLLREADAAPGARPVMLIAYSLWQSQFGADPSIVGRAVRADGGPSPVIDIVGVMPPGFGFPVAERFWLPLAIDVTSAERGRGRLDVMGSLAPGSTIDSARREFALIGERLAVAFPATNRDTRPKLATFRDEYVGDAFIRRVGIMFAAALLVLLAAAANLGNLFVARAIERRSEMVLRVALGASRWRLASLVAGEALAMAAVASAVGLGAALLGLHWFARALVTAGALDLPHGDDALTGWTFALDAVTVAVAVSGAMLVTVAAGLLAGWRAGIRNPHDALRQGGRGAGGRGSRRATQALVAAQLAVALVLLAGLAAVVESGRAVERTDFGLARETWTGRVSLLGVRHRTGPARAQFWSALLEDVRATSAGAIVALASSVPLEPAGPAPIEIAGRHRAGASLPLARRIVVSDGFFSALGARLVEGRDFAPADRADALPVVIVNEAFVRERLDGGDAVGQQVRVMAPGGDGRPRTIVGIAPDLWPGGEQEREISAVYLPLGQASPVSMTVMVRPRGAGSDSVGLVRGALARIDAGVPLYDPRTMSEVIQSRTGRHAFFGRFYVGFGIAALVLALAGLHSVIAAAVAYRRRDVALRMALGASAGDVRRLVWRQAVAPLAAGIGAGLPLAHAFAHWLSTTLFRATPPEASTLVVAAMVLSISAWLACLGPARRAGRIEPASVLRGGT